MRIEMFSFLLSLYPLSRPSLVSLCPQRRDLHLFSPVQYSNCSLCHPVARLAGLVDRQAFDASV